jgi:ATP-dependent RNA helicase DeaD
LIYGAEQLEMVRIAKRFGIDMQERDLPTDEDVQAIVSERIIALLEARLRSRDKLQTERMQRFLPLARSLGESAEEAGLLAMLLDDFYQDTFHAPVVPIEMETASSSPRPKSGGTPRRGGRPRRPRKDR